MCSYCQASPWTAGLSHATWQKLHLQPSWCIRIAPNWQHMIVQLSDGKYCIKILRLCRSNMFRMTVQAHSREFNAIHTLWQIYKQMLPIRYNTHVQLGYSWDFCSVTISQTWKWRPLLHVTNVNSLSRKKEIIQEHGEGYYVSGR